MVEIQQTLDERMETRVNEVIDSIPLDVRAAIDAIPTANVEFQRATFAAKIRPQDGAPAADELRELLMLNPGETPRDFGISVARYSALKAALGGDLLTKATPEQIERLQDIGCTIASAISTIPFIKGWEGRRMDFDWHNSQPVPPNMVESAARLNEYAALYLAMAIASDDYRARNIINSIILNSPNLAKWIVSDYVKQCLRGAQGPLVLRPELANAEQDQETRDELLQFCFQFHVGDCLMPAITEYLTFIMTKKIQVEQAAFARRRILEALTETMTQAFETFKM